MKPAAIKPLVANSPLMSWLYAFFTDEGVVKAVDHKVLQDGKEVSPVVRATPAPGRELSFLEQLIGNLGKFNSGGGGTGSAGSGGQPGPRPSGGK